MAPEAAHRRASPRSDIYSLGAILFQLVTGERPTDRTAHLEPPSTASDLSLQGSDKLWEMIKYMMKEDDDDRPYSIAEVKKDLQKIANQLAPSVDGGNGSIHRVNERRTFIIAGTTGIVTLLLGSAVTGVVIRNFLPANPHASTTLKVGSKMDNEALLLGQMYFLLLRDAGYHVIDQTLTGENGDILNSLTNKDIDIYPEFSQTALRQLNRPSTGNQLQDLQTLSTEYQKDYHIIWLTAATNLNDNYCVAIPQKKAQEMQIKNLSELAKYSKNHSLTVAVAPNGMNDVLPLLFQTYNLTFTSPYAATSELQSFKDVINHKAVLNICYSTDPLLKQYNFIVIDDDGGALPEDSPAPIIRTDVLKMAPDIDSILKPLAGVLTTNDSIALQGKLPSPTDAKEKRRELAQKIAHDWLISKGLLQD